MEKFDLFFMNANLNVKLWIERLKYVQLKHQYETTVLEGNRYASKYQDNLENMMLKIKNMRREK